MEDIQPNEVRLSRKGSARVPIIRSSHWRGRGRGYGTYRANTHNPTRNELSRCAPAQHVSHHLATPLISPEAAYNGHNVLVNPTYQFKSINQQERLLKRARISTATEGQLLGRSREKVSEHVDLTIKLPPECLKGVAGSKMARAKWTSERRQCIERDGGLSVINTRFLDPEQSIIFTCKEKSAIKRAVNEDNSSRQPIHSRDKTANINYNHKMENDPSDVGHERHVPLQDAKVIERCMNNLNSF
ncbi:hypothetical protein SCLCIDRAFT_891746 [Scleroderma citrinum Foug A]|uniref:Uncharacterized protein n=1 Tax=Scleroderma citrinum Foug A TaxID=1036808 RepID=A0A0C3A4V6_9AGAM|nr:hypothetical protein SCLCIDRAFT_891746 [Scleroderma citrinum Foug A]